jgi:hypothetical protein
MPELKGYGTDGDLFFKLTGNTSDHAIFSEATQFDFLSNVDITGTLVVSTPIADASIADDITVSNYLAKNNTTPYYQSNEWNPTTKHYVDSIAIAAGGYTDEAAQDAIGGILDDGTTGDVDFTYDDVTPKISAILKKINGFAVTDAAPSSGQGFFWNTDSSKFVFSVPSGSMVYPGVGIAVSTGSAWGASLTDNSSDWNTAYSLSHSHTNKATLDLVESAFLDADSTKLAGIEDGAEANNISDGDATDLTDGNNTTLHKHDGMYYREGEIDTLLTAKLSIANIDDTPVDGETNAPISSNWAYDHANGLNPHFLTAALSSDQTTSGTLIPLTATANSAIGDVGFIASTGKVSLGDADAIATASCMVICADATIAADSTGNWLVGVGTIRDDTWDWTVGGLIYLSTDGTTGNTLTQTAPSATDDVIQIIGVALSADIMLFNPQLVQVEHE